MYHYACAHRIVSIAKIMLRVCVDLDAMRHAITVKSLYQQFAFVSFVALEPEGKDTRRREEAIAAATLVVASATLVVAAIFTKVLPAVATIATQSVTFILLTRWTRSHVAIGIFSLGVGLPFVKERVPKRRFRGTLRAMIRFP